MATRIEIEAGVVEVDFLRRLPAVVIVGVPAREVRDIAEDVRSVIRAAGFEFPRKRIVVNITPHQKTRRPAVEMAIVLAILLESGQVVPG